MLYRPEIRGHAGRGAFPPLLWWERAGVSRDSSATPTTDTQDAKLRAANCGFHREPRRPFGAYLGPFPITLPLSGDGREGICFLGAVGSETVFPMWSPWYWR